MRRETSGSPVTPRDGASRSCSLVVRRTAATFARRSTAAAAGYAPAQSATASAAPRRNCNCSCSCRARPDERQSLAGCTSMSPGRGPQISKDSPVSLHSCCTACALRQIYLIASNQSNNYRRSCLCLNFVVRVDVSPLASARMKRSISTKEARIR